MTCNIKKQTKNIFCALKKAQRNIIKKYQATTLCKLPQTVYSFVTYHVQVISRRNTDKNIEKAIKKKHPEAKSIGDALFKNVFSFKLF